MTRGVIGSFVISMAVLARFNGNGLKNLPHGMAGRANRSTVHSGLNQGLAVSFRRKS